MGAVGGFVEDVTGINVSGQSSSDRALQGQQQASRDANATQRYIYDQSRQDAQPWMNAGSSALSQMQDPSFNKTFSMSDFAQDPGYQFRMDEANKAIERSAAARGGLNSGATLKALTRYNSDYASNEFQRARDNFNNDKNTRFGRLSQLAGMGQASAAGQAAAGQNYANAYGQNVTGAANAGAAQAVGQANQANRFLFGDGSKQSNGGAVGAAYMAFSDERLKTGVTPISKDDLAELRKTIKAYAFRYFDPKHGEGDWIGVMAQDLLKSRLGRALVVTDENGHLKIDLAKVGSLFLATMAEG